MASQNDPYFSKTLDKGLRILSLFERDKSHHSLSEISRLTGINKTSTFRLTNTLVQLGYLRKSSSNKSLSLGPRAFLLGHHFHHGFDLFQSIKPIIDKTFLEHQISIDSALLYGHELISLYRREMPNLIFFRLPLRMDELHARAMGKAVLAHFSSEELSDFLDTAPLKQLTSHTRTDKETIRKDIEITKHRGYSINNEEYAEGLICIGAALVNYHKNRVVGAVSLDFPCTEYSFEEIKGKYPRILTKLASEGSELITAIDY